MRVSLGVVGLAAVVVAGHVHELTKDTFEPFVNKHDLVLTQFFTPWCGSCKALAPEYEEAAVILENERIPLAKVDCVEAQDLCQKYGVGKVPTLKIFRGTQDVMTYLGPRKARAVISYMTTFIGEVCAETYAGYIAAGIPIAYIFTTSAEQRALLSTRLKPVAEKYLGKINFATIDVNSYGEHANNLNLEVGRWPAFAIQDNSKNQKFPYAKAGDISAISEQNIGPFVEDFLAGKIEPSIKSEPLLNKQEGHVTIIVAKNYRELVLDNNKDVLVEFYAPWCPHCKTLTPIYDQLAGIYINHSDKITIAKVDATANDVPDDIQGFPTIKLFKSGQKGEPIEYSGPRTVEDLTKFICDNGSYCVNVSDETESTEAIQTEGIPKQGFTATEGSKENIFKATSTTKEAVLDDDEAADHVEL